MSSQTTLAQRSSGASDKRGLSYKRTCSTCSTCSTFACVRVVVGVWKRVRVGAWHARTRRTSARGMHDEQGKHASRRQAYMPRQAWSSLLCLPYLPCSFSCCVHRSSTPSPPMQVRACTCACWCDMDVYRRVDRCPARHICKREGENIGLISLVISEVRSDHWWSRSEEARGVSEGVGWRFRQPTVPAGGRRKRWWSPSEPAARTRLGRELAVSSGGIWRSEAAIINGAGAGGNVGQADGGLTGSLRHVSAGRCQRHKGCRRDAKAHRRAARPGTWPHG